MSISDHTTNSGIYIIRNLKNGNFYIGQAQNLRKRWNEHRSKLRRNVHDNHHLQHSWNKYGEQSFKFLVLEYCTIEQLDKREQVHLDSHAQSDNCYNIALAATAPGRGLKRSPETRQKISDANRRRPPPSEETRRKLSESKRGKPAHNRGIPMSEEQKQKLSIAKCNPSDETRQKMSEAQKNRPPTTEETRRKISEAGKGRTHSEETCQKMSEAQKRRYARNRAEKS